MANIGDKIVTMIIIVLLCISSSAMQMIGHDRFLSFSQKYFSTLLKAKNKYTENEYFHSGYMAPEYAIKGFMTAKIDVFSFGVLILEIISGRKNYDPQMSEHNRELLKLVSFFFFFYDDSHETCKL